MHVIASLILPQKEYILHRLLSCAIVLFLSQYFTPNVTSHMLLCAICTNMDSLTDSLPIDLHPDVNLKRTGIEIDDNNSSQWRVQFNVYVSNSVH